MPTIEERLAALETKLAALTETTPTNYYAHQYSGEEIDNAVARALPNGAIDQAVGTFVRPNLLDNWYFGRPVDQRGGMIQLAGTMLYSDAACTQALFQSTKTTSIIKVSDIAAHPSDDSTVYVKLADCVRGYKGDWIYSFDRWKISPSTTVSVSGGGLSVIADFQQAILSTALILGQKYTMSVLSTDGRLGQLTFTLQQDVSINQGFGFGYFVVYRDVDQYWFRLYGSNEATYLAIKLELGSTQTLAHREGDRWVMNEVPDYGEQLRRCQRYCRVIGGTLNEPICIAIRRESTMLEGCILFDFPMRTAPSVSITGTFSTIPEFLGIEFTSQDSISPEGVSLFFKQQNGAPFAGTAYLIYAPSDTRITFSADL